jgi:hypothetical protein
VKDVTDEFSGGGVVIFRNIGEDFTQIESGGRRAHQSVSSSIV